MVRLMGGGLLKPKNKIQVLVSTSGMCGSVEGIAGSAIGSVMALEHGEGNDNEPK
jgi:hypothetical protein